MFLVFGSQQMQQVARNWFLYEITRSPLLLAMLGLANGLPMVLFSLLGGALADRFSKKLIIMVSMVGMAACSRRRRRRSCCRRGRQSSRSWWVSGYS